MVLSACDEAVVRRFLRGEQGRGRRIASTGRRLDVRGRPAARWTSTPGRRLIVETTVHHPLALEAQRLLIGIAPHVFEPPRAVGCTPHGQPIYCEFRAGETSCQYGRRARQLASQLAARPRSRTVQLTEPQAAMVASVRGELEQRRLVVGTIEELAELAATVRASASNWATTSTHHITNPSRARLAWVAAATSAIQLADHLSLDHHRTVADARREARELYSRRKQ